MASPRRTPRRTIHSTGGSMAMENSQASSRMKRNVPMAWNAHVPIERMMRNPITIRIVRLTLAGVMEIHTAWPCGGSTGAGRVGGVTSVTRPLSGSFVTGGPASSDGPPSPGSPGPFRRSDEPRPNRSPTPTREAYGPGAATVRYPASRSRLTSLSRYRR